jgi:hypothetical protein
VLTIGSKNIKKNSTTKSILIVEVSRKKETRTGMVQ